MTPATGEIIDGKYRIVRMLGQGGMGAVFEGENVRIGRRVAIKLLHANISSQAESVVRFEREARAAARIGSDHICEVLDLGVLADGTRYMVMEYLEGETLGARIERVGRLGPDQTVPIMAQVLEALGAAHAAGIIHRDLKPDNIFILPSKAGIANFVKVLDFGVSKFSQLAGEEMSKTRTGAVVGTPYYMSPEQARGGSKIDHRTDIYAMGVMLYQATTGQVPFDAETFNELLFKIVLESAPAPQQIVPDLDPEFASIIQRAMAREPPQRYQSCAEFKHALLTWHAARPSMSSLPGGRPTFHRLSNPPQHEVATPVPQRMSGSASQWNSQASRGTPVAQSVTGAQPLTANSWGDASGVTGQPARPPSKAPLIVMVVTSLTVVAGGVIAWLALGGSSSTATPAVADTASATATPVPALTTSQPEAPGPAEPLVTASVAAPAPVPPPKPEPSAAPAASATSPSTTPTQRPSFVPSKPFPQPAKSAAPVKPGPTAAPTGKPQTKPVPFDPGY